MQHEYLYVLHRSMEENHLPKNISNTYKKINEIFYGKTWKWLACKWFSAVGGKVITFTDFHVRLGYEYTDFIFYFVRVSVLPKIVTHNEYNNKNKKIYIICIASTVINKCFTYDGRLHFTEFYILTVDSTRNRRWPNYMDNL